VIADRTAPCGRASGIEPLVQRGCRSGSTIKPGSRTPRRW
jgi:hypothetical protein